MVSIDSALMTQLVKHYQAGVLLHSMLVNSGFAEAELTTHVTADGGVIAIGLDASPPALVKMLRAMGVPHITVDYADNETRTIATYEATVRNYPIALIAHEHKYLRARGASAYETEQRRAA